MARHTRDRRSPLTISDDQLMALVLADIQRALVESGFSVARRTPGL